MMNIDFDEVGYYNRAILMITRVLLALTSFTSVHLTSQIFLFFMNTYLIRNELDEEILAHLLNLDLIVTISLHLLKSCFKPSYLKAEDQRTHMSSARNIMTYGIAATIISAILVSLLEYWQFNESEKSIKFFPKTILLYAVSAILQSIAQKYKVELVFDHKFGIIALVDIIGVIPKCLFIISAYELKLFQYYGISIYGFGQLMYSSFIMLIYYILADNRTLLPRPIKRKGSQLIYVDSTSIYALKHYSRLAFVELMLDNFERILLILLNSSPISCTYSLILNLSNICSILVFVPIKRTLNRSFLFTNQQQSLEIFIIFIKIYSNVSLVFIGFFTNFCEIVLVSIYGERWITHQAITAAKTFLIYAVVLGYSQIFQAYFFSKYQAMVNRFSSLSIITTGIYMLFTSLLIDYGMETSGLFFGSIINLIMRIAILWHLEGKKIINIREFLNKLKPSRPFTLASIAIFLITHKQLGFCHKIFDNQWAYIVFGIFLFFFNTTPLIFHHYHFIKSFFSIHFSDSKIPIKIE